VLQRPPSPAGAATDATPSIVDQLLRRMAEGRESFWTAVYPLFMSRDLTREDLRMIVRAGLEASCGSYRSAVARFNMPPEDYKRFLAFLRKHDCHIPFLRFRTAPARMGARGYAAVATDRSGASHAG
jgi:hypothetical protein